MTSLYGDRMPRVTGADLDTIAEPFDILGINYYERALVQDDPSGGLLRIRHVRTDEAPRTLDREVDPSALGGLLCRLHRECPSVSLIVSENGAAFADDKTEDGRIHDQARVDFLRMHLQEVVKAREKDIPIDGYFAWSLLDNFEWCSGYSLRYGIVHVDFETQIRTPKDSAYFLRSLART